MVVYSELNLYVGLVGAAVVLLPFFFISFMFKIGKFAISRIVYLKVLSSEMDPVKIRLIR